MLERVGDLQLVCNIEERFPIAGIFEGAIFADLGNVWLFNSSDQYPGGEIKWDGFLKEIAVGIGLGLRVNVSVATLRLDFAIPLYDPGFSSEARWRLPHWSLRQIVTNFGINYPF
jgi:outer membrane protein assembly factor BamA